MWLLCLFKGHDLSVIEEFNENVGIIECGRCKTRWLHHDRCPSPLAWGEKVNWKITKDMEPLIASFYRKKRDLYT